MHGCQLRRGSRRRSIASTSASIAGIRGAGQIARAGQGRRTCEWKMPSRPSSVGVGDERAAPSRSCRSRNRSAAPGTARDRPGGSRRRCRSPSGCRPRASRRARRPRRRSGTRASSGSPLSLATTRARPASSRPRPAASTPRRAACGRGRSRRTPAAVTASPNTSGGSRSRSGSSSASSSGAGMPLAVKSDVSKYDCERL